MFGISVGWERDDDVEEEKDIAFTHPQFSTYFSKLHFLTW